MPAKKDIKQLTKKAEKQGWTVTVTGNTHLKWTSPQGEKVFSSMTPSDSFCLKKIIRDLKHRGYDPTK
jgi:hypothetical protein